MGGRVAEGARLESVYAGNRIAGSNPASSASYESPTPSPAFVFTGTKFARGFSGLYAGFVLALRQRHLRGLFRANLPRLSQWLFLAVRKSLPVP